MKYEFHLTLVAGIDEPRPRPLNNVTSNIRPFIPPTINLTVNENLLKLRSVQQLRIIDHRSFASCFAHFKTSPLLSRWKCERSTFQDRDESTNSTYLQSTPSRHNEKPIERGGRNENTLKKKKRKRKKQITTGCVHLMKLDETFLRRATKTFQSWKRNTFVNGKKRSNEEDNPTTISILSQSNE